MVRSRIVGVGGRTLPHGPRKAPESYAPGLLVLPALLGRHSLMANRQINFDVLVCDANHVRDYQLTGHGADSPIRSKMSRTGHRAPSPSEASCRTIPVAVPLKFVCLCVDKATGKGVLGTG